jgi:hypothetical protein
MSAGLSRKRAKALFTMREEKAPPQIGYVCKSHSARGAHRDQPPNLRRLHLTALS